MKLTFRDYIRESKGNSGKPNLTTRAFKKEAELVDHLKKHGAMDKTTAAAGASGGNDFHIVHPHSKEKVKGTQRKTIQGETKDNIRGAKLGSVAIRYHPKKGWHIPERTKAAKPKLSAAIEKSTTGGKPLFHHLNKTYGKPRVGKKLPAHTGDTTDMHPAHAYMHDHDVHIVHIGDRGTYRAGKSHRKDHHGTQLPVLKGTGRFVVQTERAGGGQNSSGTGMQINFRAHPNSVEKSHVDISTKHGVKHVLKNMKAHGEAKEAAAKAKSKAK